MAWSGEGATLRSPLEQVWRQFIPQGHDAALRNAFYNVAAAGFVAVAGAAAWNVYLIFQPFVRALVWAVLCGSAIHPAKTKLVGAARSWLDNISRCSSSLTVATLLLPLHTLDAMSEMIGRYVVRHVRTVVIVTVVLPVVFIVIHYTPTVLTSVFCAILSALLNTIVFIMSIATSSKYLVVGLVCCYIASLFTCWERAEYRVWLSRLSVAVWLLTGAGVAGWLFPAAATQPVFAVFCGLLLLGLAVEVLDYMKEEQSDGTDHATLVQSVVKVCKDDYDSPSKNQNKPSVSGLPSVTEEDCSSSGIENLPQEDKSRDVVRPPDLPQQLSTSTAPVSATDTPTNSSAVSATRDDPESNVTPQDATASASDQTKEIPESENDAPTEKGSASNMYIKAVFMACVLVELWRHHYLLALLPVAMVYYTIKKTTFVCLSGGLLGIEAVCGRVGHAVEHWFTDRKDALLPPPVRGIKKLVARCERSLVSVVASCLDSLVACFLIIAALVTIVSATVFLAVQIQGESMQLVAVASQIVNATVVSNPQFIALLPDDMGDTLSSALDNAYLYGRDWITKWVRDLVGNAEEAKAHALEKQVVELWDRVYQAWVVAPALATPHNSGPVVTSQAVADTFDKLVQGIANSPGLISVSSLSAVVQDNLGTVLSVAEGVWTLLLSNVSLVVSLATASASALVGGSLTLLNSVISAVVFLTALFYVLSYTGDSYKPVAMLANLAPGQMNSVGTALEEAINGVFTASCKMGIFYGLWTWLLHSLFATNIVYIPAVLGAVFGAVPLVGTYWACVPGLLELWWGHNSPTLALLLLACQLAPLSCVDTAVYAEIKGGGHPYLTGLAVGGGIFCWGAEGAILGPLLLCTLLVATNLYTALIRPPPPATRLSRLRRNLQLAER